MKKDKNEIKANQTMARPEEAPSAGKWSQLLEIMSRLRSEDGCPWDREQTHESLKRYLLEEAYEVIDAIDSGSSLRLTDELGDVLLQVVFHAQIGREKGLFDAGDVLDAINSKMIRRHPHVFGGGAAEDAQAVLNQWELIKAREQNGDKPKGLMEVNENLPALMLAQKVQDKASRLGFDWENIQGPWDKLHEELDELKAAVTWEERRDELGDCLFALINIARFMDIDAEDALRHTVKKFLGRFQHIEKTMGTEEQAWENASLEELDQLWEEAKALERQGKGGIPCD